MKKLMSIMLAMMMIFAFNAMAAPTNKAAIKKVAPVYDETCCLLPPAPDVSVKKAELKAVVNSTMPVFDAVIQTVLPESPTVKNDAGNTFSPQPKGDALFIQENFKDVVQKMNYDDGSLATNADIKKTQASEQKMKDKSSASDDSSLGTNDAIDAENDFDKEVPAVIPLK